MKLKVTINGKAYEAEKGELLLNLCRRNRILIPTLCHHEGLSGLGACRLCVVEVNEGGGNKVVVSCVYPLSRDCKVFTESEKIKNIRKTILSMLITRAPAGDRLASLCHIYGVESDQGSANKRFASFKPVKGTYSEKLLASSCVLCGLCAQACASLGTGAISTAGRGVGKKVSTPYGEPSADCVGCGSCAAVCPTRAIECSEGKGYRSIWGRKFKLLHCASCNKSFATGEEYALALEKAGTQTASVAHDVQDRDAMAHDATGAANQPPLCDSCRRKKSADVLAGVFGARTRE